MAKTYDGLFILGSALRDESLERVLDRARAEIVRMDGRIESTEIIGKRMFARPGKKRESGIYACIRFALDPVRVRTLRERYRLIDDIYRVQMLLVDERREAALQAQRERQAAHHAAVTEAQAEVQEEARKAARDYPDEED